MKILVISHMYPQKNRPNYGLFVENQVASLKRRGHEIVVVVPSRFRLTIPGVEYINYASLSNLGLLFVDRAIEKKIKKIVNVSEFDLILAHTVLPDGAVANRLGKEFGKPVAIYIHGADVQKKAKISYLLPRLKKVIRCADLVLVNSRKTKGLTDKMLGTAGAKVSYLGVNEERVYPKNSSSTLRVLTVANLVPEKGIEYAIRAVNSLREDGLEINYDIVGGGPLEGSLKKIAKGNSGINFYGPLENATAKKMMAAADIFLLPSHNEAFGVVYLESLWQKTPVIGCKGQGVEDIIMHGECGLLVEPRSVSSIKKALAGLIDKGARERMGQVGQRVVRENFLWDVTIKKLEADLKELLN